MSHLALIPVLETLPGWPDVAEPTLMESLVVILGVPAAIAAVATLVLMGPHWFRTSQGQGKELERT